MTPNRTEASLATGICIKTPQDALQAGRKLCQDLQLDLSIVTLDCEGIALVMPDGQGNVYPTRPRGLRHHRSRRHGAGHDWPVPGQRRIAGRCGAAG